MKYLTLVLTLLIAGPVAAQQTPHVQPDNVGGLAKMCGMLMRSIDYESRSSDTQLEAGICLGYLEADVHVQSLVPAPALRCIPVDVDLGQRARILIKWAEDHPEKHHVPKLIGLRMALVEAFPCPSQ